ncbi:MAG: hypothetical protein IJJ33_02215 [Victivallales bacterium]|nr:hypothetical protein [Victivallales bacterium]
MILSVQVSTNRYAPPGAQAVNMYSMDGGEKLTLGQLMAAVCIRAGMNKEAQSVNKMNIMNNNVEDLKTASEYLDQLATNSVSNWATVRDFLRNTLGMTSAEVPDSLDTSYSGRFKVINAMKNHMEALTRQAQEDMIDVQSLISQRDVAFTTGSSLVKSTGGSSNNIASNL